MKYTPLPDMINTRNDSGIRPFPRPPPRPTSTLRVNHVRLANPLIKTALRPFLLLLLLEKANAGHSGEPPSGETLSRHPVCAMRTYRAAVREYADLPDRQNLRDY